MKIATNPQKIKELLARGVEEVIVKESLEKKLKSGKKLRVKFGIDPTASDLHLGHSVPLRKLRAFQELGHQVIFLIGDFTATVGDPSGRNELRPALTIKEVKENMKSYLKQAAKILDINKAEIRHNSEWYKDSGWLLLHEITSKMSIRRVLERDDFQKRLKQDRDISVLEIIYPLLQGYDSVMLKADVEIGGADQKFNLLMGRRLQRKYNQPEQDILTTWLIEGTDGARKMSKSYDNYIALEEQAGAMYAKIMSIPDDLVIKYFRCLTGIPEKEIELMKEQLRHPSLYNINPKDLKARLAFIIVEMYHDSKAAQKAEQEFNRLFREKNLPQNIPSYELRATSYSIIDLLLLTKLASSKSAAQRLISQGGVKLNQKKITDWRQVIKIKNGDILQVGKRRFMRLKM